MNQQIEQRRKTEVMDAMDASIVQDQLKTLLCGNPQKLEEFRTKILQLSLQSGLSNCSPESIIGAALNAVVLNLPLEAGQGYVVNYGGKAAFDAGYKGWRVLAKRAGFDVVADTVYVGDEFSCSGFGFDKQINFKHGSDRKPYDDGWAKSNLTHVIVSILEHETGLRTSEIIEAGMIHKIVGKSPSMASDQGRAHSPHSKWADQMFKAKAIKQVVSKLPVDIEKGRDLHRAVKVINETESHAQALAEPAVSPSYPDEKFDDYYPQWQKLVESGRKTPDAIRSQLQRAYTLTDEQIARLQALYDVEPIEVEAR